MDRAYYNNDRYLKIVLTGNPKGPKTEVEFQAYVTIIKNNWTEVEDPNCVTKADGNSIRWSNLDPRNIGYPNNARCTYDLVIPKGTEVVAIGHILLLEDFVDHVNFYIDANDTTQPVDFNLIKYEEIVFVGPGEGEEERLIPWEFTSDGSWRSFGFLIEFQTQSNLVLFC